MDFSLSYYFIGKFDFQYKLKNSIHHVKFNFTIYWKHGSYEIWSISNPIMHYAPKHNIYDLEI
jgi:hypothetical protein